MVLECRRAVLVPNRARGRLDWMGDVLPPLGSSAAGGVRARVCVPGLACLLFRAAVFCGRPCCVPARAGRAAESHRGLWARGISGGAICPGGAAALLVTSTVVSWATNVRSVCCFFKKKQKMCWGKRDYNCVTKLAAESLQTTCC